MDNRTWRRSFAAGVIALGLSVGGSFVAQDSEAMSCPAVQRVSGTQWVMEKFAPRVTAPPLLAKVARAAMNYAFGTCG